MPDSLSSISGVSSGVDWKALVDSIMSLERRPAAKLETAITANTKRKEAFEQYRAAVASLKSATDSLKDGSAFDAFTAATSGTDAGGARSRRPSRGVRRRRGATRWRSRSSRSRRRRSAR